MNKVSIKGTGSALAENVITNEYLESIMDTSDEWITTRTGIKERRFIREDQALSDLAVPACRKALEMAGAEPGDVDLIIVGTATGDMVSPATACFVQRELGAVNAAAFDVNAACPGFIYAITVADKFIRCGSNKLALAVGGDILNNRIDYEDRTTAVLFGDGCGAAVVGLADDGSDSELLGTTIRSNGELWDLIQVPGGGSLHAPSAPYLMEQRLPFIKMKGRETFKHAVTAMIGACQEVMDANNVKSSDIDWFVPHQANIRIMDAVAKRLEIPMEKVVVTVNKYGNTSAGTVPTALDEAVRDGRIKRGDLVLLTAFGAGLVWGAVLFRF